MHHDVVDVQLPAPSVAVDGNSAKLGEHETLDPLQIYATPSGSIIEGEAVGRLQPLPVLSPLARSVPVIPTIQLRSAVNGDSSSASGRRRDENDERTVVKVRGAQPPAVI